ncbi:unnamed protein product [Cylicocyclus nassatus]|uniref:Major facilitator superfamily (MFS) profile domain-containing protein n=1 Tax=Cylicocyclus nassatus TaxID=53992 RepID=A0AA36DJD9_CYLNA|nr:unnamed protein product [Cylicocyclus nassatus]
MIQEEKSKDVRSGEENKPLSIDKLVDGSGELKSGEERRAGESAMASKEVPKPESKSEEGKLSSDEKVKHSSEEGVRKEDGIDKTGKISEKERQEKEKNSGSILQMSILIAVNLLDYIDKFTLAGVLSDVQAFYGINDALGGLLQTVYIVCAMIISPVWGFLGDRYNRKYLMTGCLVLWTCTVLLSTFVPSTMFWLFACSRGVIAFGQTCYTALAPSVIGDLYAGGSRSRMLMLFYFAIPCGSGLGFMIGGSVAAFAGHWRWGVGITFVLGIACTAFMVIFLKEPERGAAEKRQGETSKMFAATTFFEDLRSLSTNLTYILVTAAYTAILFTVGTLSWWTPTTIVHNEAHQMGLNHTHLLPTSQKDR